jgi:hypothetical protein
MEGEVVVDIDLAVVPMIDTALVEARLTEEDAVILVPDHLMIAVDVATHAVVHLEEIVALPVEVVVVLLLEIDVLYLLEEIMNNNTLMKANQ